MMALDHLRETFTIYLAFGIMLSFASIWAAVMALRAERTPAERGDQDGR